MVARNVGLFSNARSNALDDLHEIRNLGTQAERRSLYVGRKDSLFSSRFKMVAGNVIPFAVTVKHLILMKF